MAPTHNEKATIMIEIGLIQKILNWSIIGMILLAFISCSMNKKYIGFYKDTSIKGAHCYSAITLNEDNSAVYNWWTDILMTNEGSWSVSNDTIVFIDSSYRQIVKTFVFKNRKLMEIDKISIYKKRRPGWYYRR